MNKHIRFGLWVLPFALLAGCTAGPPESGDPAAAGPGPEQEVASPAIQLDSSALVPLAGTLMVREAPTQALALPAERLSLDSFQHAHTVERFVQTDEPFFVVRDMGAKQRLESASFWLESGAGRFTVLRRPDAAAGPSFGTDEDSLRTAAHARLRAWGVPDAEVGQVWQRQAMTQERVAGVASEPQVHAHKTFFIRAIHGVEVQGHRAVITHAPDGTFVRAVVNWPALAASGHALRTQLGVRAIEDRARAALGREEGSIGKARLRWKYVPEELPSGEVRLKLVVGAKAPVVTEEGMSEPREVDVEVDAVP